MIFVNKIRMELMQNNPKHNFFLNLTKNSIYIMEKQSTQKKC